MKCTNSDNNHDNVIDNNNNTCTGINTDNTKGIDTRTIDNNNNTDYNNVQDTIVSRESDEVIWENEDVCKNREIIQDGVRGDSKKEPTENPVDGVKGDNPEGNLDGNLKEPTENPIVAEERIQEDSSTENHSKSSTNLQQNTQPNTINSTDSQTNTDTLNHSQGKHSPTVPPSYERHDTLSSLFQESFERSSTTNNSESIDDMVTSPIPSPWYFLYCRLSQSSQQSNHFTVVGMKIPVGGGAPNTGVQAVRTWFIFAIPKRR